jgi:hypothetical protein
MNSMKDFVTPEERLSNPTKHFWYDLIAVVLLLLVGILGGLQSWH